MLNLLCTSPFVGHCAQTPPGILGQRDWKIHAITLVQRLITPSNEIDKSQRPSAHPSATITSLRVVSDIQVKFTQFIMLLECCKN